MLSRCNTSGKRIAFIACYCAVIFAVAFTVLFFSTKTYTVCFDLSGIDTVYDDMYLEQTGDGRVRQLSLTGLKISCS